MRPEDLPKYLVVDSQPLKQIFLLKKKINKQNLLVVTQFKHLADLSHTFKGLTICCTFETLRLPHTQHFSARGSMNQVVSKGTVVLGPAFALTAITHFFFCSQSFLNTALFRSLKGWLLIFWFIGWASELIFGQNCETEIPISKVADLRLTNVLHCFPG